MTSILCVSMVAPRTELTFNRSPCVDYLDAMRRCQSLSALQRGLAKCAKLGRCIPWYSACEDRR